MAMIASKNQNSALRAQIHSNSRSRKATSASCMIQSWQEQAWQENGLPVARGLRQPVPRMRPRCDSGRTRHANNQVGESMVVPIAANCAREKCCGCAMYVALTRRQIFLLDLS